MKKSPPSVIPLSYDYQKMSPSSATHPPTTARSDVTSSFLDNQYQSLFGDPVPPSPSEDYLGHLDGSFYGSFRRDSFASAIADDFNRTITLATDSSRRASRLFSETPITSTSMGLSPRMGPDIQILPDSGSAHSSSDAALASPNYALLRPSAVSRQTNDETYDDVADGVASELQDFVEHDRAAKEVSRRISDFSEDFKSNVGSLRQSPPEIPEPPSRYNRQISNDSYSSNEWFKPMSTYPEFTKMPKLRPSSKNVLSIKQFEMPPPQGSPVAAMINDSNGSSSGEDQRQQEHVPTRPPDPRPSQQEHVPARPPDPPPSRLRSLQRQSSSSDVVLPSLLPSPPPPLPPAPLTLPPPPPPPAPLTLPPPEPAPPPSPIVSEMSPIILTDSITTGADHRVTVPRTHKKSSFTIIAEKSPQSSRSSSPQKLASTGRVSPFLGHGFREPEKPPKLELSESPQKPVAKPRMLHQKSLSTTHLKLPSISGPTIDDSPRPSVQFNMSGKGPINMQMTHQKGILQMGKDQSSSSQETPRQPDALAKDSKMRSCEALPLITDPYRTAIPRLSAPTRPIIPTKNPTRAQRGLLRVINSADSTSRIPVRSNWASMDDLSIQRRPPLLSPLRIKARRRSSSTSPERRSSTQTEPRSSIASDRRSSNLSSVTTSDFSFRRNSVSPLRTPLTVRRKSIVQTAKTSRSTPSSPSNRLGVNRTTRKVVKPTTLSPIIGTPNKDLSQTSTSDSQPISVSLSRRDSQSRIPIFSPTGGSRSNSRLSSRGNSRMSSRSSSPLKEHAMSPRIPSSRSPSRQTLRTESRVTSRGGSRPTSRASRIPSSRSPSRQTLRPDSRISRIPSRGGSRPVSRAESMKGPSRSPSRASTRQASRTTSRAASRATSRASTRPNSRMEQARAIANSRSNSRLSTRSESPIKSRKVSPPKNARRTKSSSRSPVPKRTRRKSISQARTPVLQRRNSRSRIPARIPTSKSSPKPKVPPKNGTRRESPKRASIRKQPISAKKPATTSVTRSASKIVPKKPASDARRTPQPIKKSTTTKPSKSGAAASAAVMKSRQSSNLQSSNLQKTGAELKRESSSVRQAIIAAAMLKREASSMSLKKTDPKGEQPSTSPGKLETTAESPALVEAVAASKNLKRQPSTVTLLSIGSKLSLLRKRTDSNLSKKLDDMKKTAEGKDGAKVSAAGEPTESGDGSSNGKLVALTKANVVSMTTAAITAQPVQISTVLANQLPKASSSGQLLVGQEDMALPAAILEKSQKTLENIQKTVTEATDEIQKTITDNLTDLKTLESDMEKIAEELTGSPLPFEKSESITTIIENRSPTNAENKASAAGSGAADDAFGEPVQKSAKASTHPIEANVTVVNAKDGHEAGHGLSDTTGTAATHEGLAAHEDSAERNKDAAEMGVSGGDPKTASNESKPSDGKGDKHTSDMMAGVEDISKAGSQDPLDAEKDQPKGCCKRCRCSTCFCIPCRRSRCSKCCGKKPEDPEAASLSTVELVDEKKSCWKRMKCCNRKPKPPKPSEASMHEHEMETIREEPEAAHSHVAAPPKQSKCGLCMSKVFCCRSVNKVEAVSGDMEEVRKCCFCIPCRKKKSTPAAATSQTAWQDPEQPQVQSTESTTTGATPSAPQGGCCSRFWQKMNCFKKKPSLSDSRRASMKQGSVPPPEDTRRKLHVDLVEYNSKMKGAIPVMPLYLAWFCAISNTLVPGLGTLMSGFFCICVGIPRFTQYDSAKARLGSLIINCIVAVAQMFCVLFCFVGWGWSIWWGTIMLKTAKKLSKIKKVEKLEMEEEKRQADMAAAAAAAQATDVEAGKT